jgi:peptide/nickel transport system permease protein
MQQYIFRRLMLSIPTLIGVTVLIFIAMRVIPGDPLARIQSEGTGTHMLTEEQLQAARASLGLDKPYPQQYLEWIGAILRGDLGQSFWRGDSVREIIMRRLPITAEIAAMAIVVAWIIGVPVGILGAIRPNSWVDLTSRLGVIVFLAIPSFWLGLLLIMTSVLWFNWRPSLSIVYFTDDPVGNLQMVIGPALVMGVGLAAVIARVARAATLEVLNEDYVRTARAKGASEKSVLLVHVLRNALLPIVTVSGLAFGGLLGGSVAVERAFGVPGLGQALVLALTERDWMLIQNLVLLYGLIFTALNLLVDLSYAWIDPRIRYG